MKIEYVGSHDEVEIAATGAVCKRGDSVEVSAALGKSLLEQESNWKPAKKSGNSNNGQEQ